MNLREATNGLRLSYTHWTHRRQTQKKEDIDKARNILQIEMSYILSSQTQTGETKQHHAYMELFYKPRAAYLTKQCWGWHEICVQAKGSSLTMQGWGWREPCEQAKGSSPTKHDFGFPKIQNTDLGKAWLQVKPEAQELTPKQATLILAKLGYKSNLKLRSWPPNRR